MDKDLLKQLTLWHNKSQHAKIINKIMDIPEVDRDYDLVCLLARALNNQENYNEAIQYFLSVQEQGEHDPLWHFRIGYAYYYLEQYKEAIVAFEQAVALDPEDSHGRTFLEMSRNAAARAGNETIHIVNVEKGMRIGTDPRLLEVEEKINPFGLVAHNNGSISMILGVGKYKHEIFQTRAEEGCEGNGYDWGSLAAVFLEEKMPHLVDIIRFDPEADTFCIYTDNKEAILSFAIAFKEACEDDSLMKDLFSRAVLD
ncbi:Imm51 family immunity protein [Paenibacillus sp. FSL K6-0276]|uniref:Imm51 family immunity protein n=1 Tax=Paenibacillus sp. FSL K6-0276 TaxID=2921450 RepID=UPI0030ED7C13